VSEVLGLSLCRSAADLGHSSAQFLCRICLSDGRGCDADEAAAQSYLRRAMDAGDSLAAAAYVIGDDATDRREAIECLRRSPGSRHALAQARLGSLLMKGEGAGRDLPGALEQFELAAEQGNAFGQLAFGAMLLDGKPGFPANPARGAALMKKAADQGLSPAQAEYARARGRPRCPAGSERGGALLQAGVPAGR
jgi:TPR repeat protein